MTPFEQAVESMKSERIARKWFPSLDKNLGATGGANVLCGAVTSVGPKVNQYPCHNPIRTYHNAEVIWSCFGWRTSESAAKTYFDWLVHKSPWAKTGIVPEDLAANFMFEQGFVFQGLDKTPANLLHNFLIASRMPAEWASHINSWHELVTEHKVNPDLAFLILTCFQTVTGDASNSTSPFQLKTESVVTFIDKYDWPLDMGRATEQYVKNFLRGKTPGLSATMFFPTAETRPINTLWGDLVPNGDGASYATTLRRLYDKDFTTKRLSPSTRMFFSAQGDKSGSAERVYTPEALLEITKLEEVRLYGS